MAQKSVEEIIAQLNFSDELLKLRQILLETELTETVKWGMPVYTVHGQNIVGIGVFKTYFGLWFYQGAMLDDPASVLINAQEGKTKALRQWRMHSARDIKTGTIKKYIREAIMNAREGKQISIAKAKVTYPKIDGALAELLATSKNLKTAFGKLSPAKQAEYARYVLEAKRETTKQSRIEKIRPLILEGKGLNDKYRK